MRRALVAAGAVIGGAGEIGYGPSPAAPARVVDSALTLVLAVAESSPHSRELVVPARP